MGNVAEAGKVVIIHYTLTNDEGEVLDSSSGGDPLAYLHGQENIVPGLEEGLNGLAVGTKIDVVVPPEKGYGILEEGEPQPVPRDAFPEGMEIEEGMQFMIENDEGVAPVWVVGVEGDEIYLDGRHPLAGETLHFAVEIMAVREPSAEEVAHGHPHGLDGTDHHHH